MHLHFSSVDTYLHIWYMNYIYELIIYKFKRNIHLYISTYLCITIFTYNATCSENNLKDWQNRSPTVLNIKRRPHQEGRRVRDAVGNQTPNVVTHMWQGYHRHWDPPWVRGSSSTSGTPTRGIYTGNMNPHNVWLWKSEGFSSGRTGALWEARTL